MAGKVYKKTQPKKAAPKKSDTPKKPKDDSSIRIWFALIFFFLSVFLAISCISYVKFWNIDQDLAGWSTLFDMTVDHEPANWGGRAGAILANYVVGNWFGIFGLCVPLILFISAIKLLNIKLLSRKRGITSLTLLAIIGSVSAGHFFGYDPEVFGSGWGGEQGIFMAGWLSSIFGGPGTSLLLVTLFVGLIAFFNSRILVVFGNIVNFVVTAPIKWVMAASRRPEKPMAEPTAAEPTPLSAENGGEPASQAAATAMASNIIGADTQDELPPYPFKEDLNDETLEMAAIGYSEPEAEPEGGVAFTINSSALTPTSFDTEPFINDHPFDNEVDISDSDSTPEEEEEINFVVTNRDEEEMAPEPIALPKVADEPQFKIDTHLQDEELLPNEIVNTELYDPTLELSSYQKPPIELLVDHTTNVRVTEKELIENKNRIVETLENFNIKIDKIEATPGPTVTLYEIIPAPGVRISKIKNLEDDIALSLSALGIRIIAPIPGKGTIGIEVPNKDKETVSMYSVIKSAKFHNSTYDLPVALGKTIQNETYVIDLAKMPHLLVAGATGQGKSVGLNAIITSLLYKKHPSELKFVLVDPKKVELTLYSRLEKHFLAKLPDADEAIITDTQKVIYTLNSLCLEMDTRYDLLKMAKVRNIKEYNAKFVNRKLNPENGHRYLPYFVVIVDEFADLIMTAGREIETPIARIAQLARAVGIHLVIATQRPTTNIITGVIKANFPARMAFRVSSMVDSRTILDQPGANQLIGRGDMLIQAGSDMVRVQCAFVDTPEVEDITEFIGNQRGYASAYELPEYVPEGDTTKMAETLTRRDGLFEEVARYVVSHQQGSASTIQRNFSIGFNRAGRIIDQLEAAGIVGRQEGSKPRQVLIADPSTLEIILGTLDR